jgi:hypothetical protein
MSGWFVQHDAGAGEAELSNGQIYVECVLLECCTCLMCLTATAAMDTGSVFQ